MDSQTSLGLRSLPLGFRIGPNRRYEILSELGQGGFGITYKAMDHDLSRQVAIKEFLPSFVAMRGENASVVPLSDSVYQDYDWALQLFLKEARTLAQFHHKNIVAIHDVFEANGTAYIVMAYLEGITLSQWLRERPGGATRESLDRVLLPISDALGELHNIKIIHRDIKPGNIYLTANDVPVLLDFGAAKVGLGQHSKSINAILTPPYAPFEQYRTDGDQGPHTDVYALSATAYECITGEQIPEAPSRVGPMDPYEPLVGSQHENRSGSQWAQAIDRGLGIWPEERPRSIHEFRELIQMGAQRPPHQPTIGTPPPIPVSPQSPIPNHGAQGGGAPPTSFVTRITEGFADRPGLPLKIAIGVLGLAIIGGAIALLSDSTVDKEPDPRPGSPTDLALLMQEMRHGAADSKWEDVVRHANAVLEKTGAQRPLPKYAVESHFWRGIARYHLEDHQPARDDLSVFITDYEDHPGLEEHAPEALVTRGLSYSELGQYSEADQDLAEAVKIDPKSIGVLETYGRYLLGRHDYARAEEVLTNAINNRPNDKEFVAAYRLRGTARIALKKWALAQNDLTIWESSSPTAETLTNSGITQLHLGQLEDARKSFNKALQTDPDFAAAYGNRALAWYEMGRWDDAVQDASNCITKNPKIWEAYVIRGRILADKKARYREAIEDFKRAIEVDPEIPTPYFHLHRSYSAVLDFKREHAARIKYDDLRVKSPHLSDTIESVMNPIEMGPSFR